MLTISTLSKLFFRTLEKGTVKPAISCTKLRQ